MKVVTKCLIIISICLTILTFQIIKEKNNGYEYITLSDNTTLHIAKYTTDGNKYKVITTDGNIYNFESYDIIACK